MMRRSKFWDRQPNLSWRELPTWGRPFYIVGHPAMLLPTALVGIRLFGNYTPPEITQARLPLFLQGSTDWGGSNIFAVTVALYLWFGLIGAIWLTLVSHERTATISFGRALLANAWRMRFHLMLFLLFGILRWNPWTPAGEGDPDPDFRNMFILVLLLYAASFLIVTALSRRRLALSAKVLASPALLYLWLAVGSDGNTPKAGQMLFAYQKPVRVARSVRHGIMLRWYQVCDVVLRDL